MRIVKEAEERKNEILDAAGELFSQKGFDRTSTGDILEKVGIARGTLYYHFKSKEDIMDSLIERSTVRILSAAQKAAADKTIPVIERIINVILALNIQSDSSSDTTGQEMIEHMHSPQNALMHQKTQKVILANITPILADIIREGIKEGLFSTPFPYESMEMATTYASIAFDDDDTIEVTEETRNTRMQAFVFNMERLLGAEGGSFAESMMRIFGQEN